MVGVRQTQDLNSLNRTAMFYSVGIYYSTRDILCAAAARVTAGVARAMAAAAVMMTAAAARATV